MFGRVRPQPSMKMTARAATASTPIETTTATRHPSTGQQAWVWGLRPRVLQRVHAEWPTGQPIKENGGDRIPDPTGNYIYVHPLIHGHSLTSHSPIHIRCKVVQVVRPMSLHPRLLQICEPPSEMSVSVCCDSDWISEKSYGFLVNHFYVHCAGVLPPLLCRSVLLEIALKPIECAANRAMELKCHQ